MTSLAIAATPELPGVVRIAPSEEWPRPWVLIIGSLHGDEPCGIRAIEGLLSKAQTGDLPLSRGTLITMHGNPEASARGLRHTEGGVDLNRLFDFRFEVELPRSEWSPEHHRALALRPLVESVDAALDLHSARAPTPPFAICTASPGSAAIGAHLGLDYVTFGWEGPGLLGHKVVLSSLTRRGLPGVAVECGSHDDPDAPRVALDSARRFLTVLGLTDGPAPARGAPTFLRIRGAVKRPGPSFRFDEPIVGMEELSRGRVVGSDHDLEIRLRRDCRAVMPNDQVPEGEDMLYLAAEEPAPPQGGEGAWSIPATKA